MKENKTSAGGVVFKKVNNHYLWLVVKNAFGKHWGWPKGFVGDKNINETLEQAALREVEEEGGVKTKIVQKINYPVQYTYTWESAEIAKTVWFFLMKYLSGNPKDHDQEIEEAKFIETKAVPKILTFDNDKEVFEKALQLGNFD